MTTLDRGLPRLRSVRAYAATLEDRRAYLIGRLAGKVEAIPDFDPMGSYELAEIQALGHVLALLDAEWDNLARLRRNVDRIEGRLAGHYRAHGEDTDAAIKVVWEQPSTRVDTETVGP